jgi:hypothetical protein
MNDGDWVESCTALVETHEGIWKIIHWTKEKDDEPRTQSMVDEGQ